MWNLEVKRKEHYNCFQNVIASIADFYHTSHLMMFLELWGFKYNKEREGNIGDKLGLSWMGQYDRRCSLLEKYHDYGFRVHIRGVNFEEEVTAALQKSPVGFYLDSYLCEWTEYYQVQHREHLVLCLEEGQDSYICVDDTCEAGKNVQLTKEFVGSYCKEYVSFYTTENIGENNIANELGELIRYVDEKGMFVQYEAFVDDIVNSLDIAQELQDKSNPVSARLFMLLKNIADDRYNMREVLEYIGCKTGMNFESCNEKLLEISRKYEKVRAYLIRCYFLSKKQDVDIVNREFTAILQLEREIYDELKRLCN